MTNETLYKNFCYQCKRLQNVQGDLMCLESAETPINQFDDGYRGMHGWIGHIGLCKGEVSTEFYRSEDTFKPPDDCDFKLERMVFEQKEIRENDTENSIA